ncbi:MAG: hypothetical protein B1H40_00100 [Candidatus Latescibacteria bacterium 4484_181]|nr:MAG: hypothetical protein B1H40_00100 [Candidatus Latescibacteria bacterium 4484_181]
MQVQTSIVNWPKTMFEDAEPRAEGLHLSIIIDSLLDRAGLGYKGKGFTDMQLTAEIGLLWENVLSKVMRDKYATRPPQICEDGIWMSPDGIGPDPEGEVPLIVEEYKATWKAVKNSLAEDFRYMTQVKAYCRAVGTTVAIMRVFYVMGDYRGSGPLYKVARFTFSEAELKANWDMILKEKARMEKGDRKG